MLHDNEGFVQVGPLGGNDHGPGPAGFPQASEAGVGDEGDILRSGPVHGGQAPDHQVGGTPKLTSHQGRQLTQGFLHDHDLPEAAPHLLGDVQRLISQKNARLGKHEIQVIFVGYLLHRPV